eukprot:CAMPEP_0181455528 /NCGR_PEP_ID=MMETSP1110-20121109/30805_1 /TAXON_ID=174948 /ORGANISM="Symbiodinium sp., Strain CCMP421" /LENGTH=967 /DNA_ID=CAMNT_0023579917 /DNA_START=72 /DNA_END=2976 /DNA_ORIENTATION=-
MHVPAAAAAAGTAYTGKWLFDYNRANFQYDVPQRFGRFMTSRGMLNTQVGQYRQDVHGIAELTSSKMDTVQAMMTLVLCVCAALSDAGRIGMHGCAPPQWLVGLYSGHIYTSILYCGTALWLGMHGSLRAQCAMTSLLTRKVRLPIPSMAQLDAARSFGSAFEQQKFGDIFRVPFMRHPEDAPELPPADPGDSGEDDDDKNDKKEKGSKDGKKPGKKKASKVHLPDPRTEFSSTARDTVPSWIRDEQVVDKGGGLLGLPSRDDFEPHETPDHFKMLLAAQEEWWQYDVYARVLMLYGSCQFLYAVCYYCIGTTTAELRGFWISWSMPMLFMAAQVLILRLDVVRTSGNHMLPNAEWIGHLAPYFAVTATTLEYRHLYSPTTVILTWVFVFLTYFAHIVMAMRFLDLAWPDWNRATDMPDEPGKPWWPSSWKVPSAFRNALWLLAPPKKLEPGQHDLLHEAEGLQSTGGGAEIRRRGKDKKGKSGGKVKEVGEGLVSDEAGESSPTTYRGEAEGAYTGRSPFKAFAEARSPDLPWQLARVAICTVGGLWLYMGIALFVEMNVGPDTLMKPPGEPPWIRDQKMKNVWVPKGWHMSSEPLPSDYRLESSTLAKYEEGSVGGFNPDDIHSPGVGESGVQESHGSEHGGEHGGHESHSAHRRLAGEDGQLLRDLLKATDGLAWLHDSLKEIEANQAAPLYELPPSPAVPFMAPTVLNAKKVKWPSLFEPHHLLCRGSQLMALTSCGFGAHLANLDDEEVDAAPFALEGLGAVRSLVGGAWLDEGLQLITKVGELFDCPGVAPMKGRWSCKNSTMKLPLPHGSQLLAAAISKTEESGHIAALLFDHAPATVNLFHGASGSWTSAGEVHLPSDAGHVGLSISGQDLLALLGTNGAVLRRHIVKGSTTWHPSPPATQMPREYRGACSKDSEVGGLIRLAIRQAAPKTEAWLPELSLDDDEVPSEQFILLALTNLA